MNTRYIPLFIIAIAYAFTPPHHLSGAEEAKGEGAEAVDIKVLSKHWVHSREEQEAGAKEEIFRPAGSKKFPPSRFRMAYKFSEDGDCQWKSLEPTDRHRFREGKWELDADDPRLLKVTMGKKTQSFRIAELSEEILRLVPVR